MVDDAMNTVSATTRSLLLKDYEEAVRQTDELPPNEIHPVLFGLYGEVGSVLSTAKKLDREKSAYKGYIKTIEEEFGDVLWYFAALCVRLKIPLDEVFSHAATIGGYNLEVAASDQAAGTISHVAVLGTPPTIRDAYLNLGMSLYTLSKDIEASDDSLSRLAEFANSYMKALRASGLIFSNIAQGNRAKALGRFSQPLLDELPTFDSKFSNDERLPDTFEIKISERPSGLSYLQWNGVFIGDPLTDNIRDPDGYRFHDVFHMAHAAVLHWSPTFRALIKHKRKSDKKIDEAQDGGRAIVVEEGLTAWIFSRSKEINFFHNQSRVSFDLLKTISEFVQGYEVDECPLKLWELAILQGYEVFSLVRDARGGIVIGDRRSRTLKYRPLT